MLVVSVNVQKQKQCTGALLQSTSKYLAVQAVQVQSDVILAADLPQSLTTHSHINIIQCDSGNVSGMFVTYITDRLFSSSDSGLYLIFILLSNTLGRKINLI